MKKNLLINFMRSENNLSRFSFLFLCLFLSMNLSGQNIHTSMVETWTSGNWVKSLMQTYTYDGSGYLTNVINQTWDATNLIWVNSTQSNYTNNPDGTANVVTMQSWDGSIWNDATKTTYTYNASKKVLTATTQFWLVVIWQNSTMQTNTYDINGYLINTVNQTWATTLWQNSSQTIYTNNGNGTVNHQITQTWDAVNTLWVNSRRSTFTYNGSNKILTDITDTWTSGNWQSYSQETNTYDGSGYLTGSLSQLWSTGTLAWVNDTQSAFSNNTDGTISQITVQNWDGVSAWVNDSRITYTYSTSTGVSELLKGESYIIYPNPSADYIKIKGIENLYGSTYSITDQKGIIVLNGRLTDGSSTIDISTLSNGIYILYFGDRNQHAYKLIKDKNR